MLGIHFFKADSSTHVIKSVAGKVRRQGRGLSFFYNAATTSIAAIPVNVQEAPFIFTLQTADYQEVSIQGQVAFRVERPETIAEIMNFTLGKDGQSYRTEDPKKLDDRVVRTVQAVIQMAVEQVSLREALHLSQSLVSQIKEALGEGSALGEMGLTLVDLTIARIHPKPETARALEAEAREAILKEADDAIYRRRKSAVEQERTIKDAELQTELAIQQKEQEIEENRIANERAVLRGEAETERERQQNDIEREISNKELVQVRSDNRRLEADAEAYQLTARVNAVKALPVENLKVMALAHMTPEQLLAMALETLAENAGKIGELNLGPDLLSQVIRRGARA